MKVSYGLDYMIEKLEETRQKGAFSGIESFIK